jgi:hypothetical protein
MILGTASSTPLLTLMAVAVFLLAYPLRRYAGTAAWGVVAMLFALHIVMRAPVWHLLARVGVVSGSTGWHRYYLVNQAIENFWEWMLLGTRDTGHWGLGLLDVTNQFILEGVRGGLITLILFCAILLVVGRAFVRLSVRSSDKRESYLAWCAFVTLLAHVVSFFGVSYFGQITMPWYLLLASAGHFYGRVHAPPVPAGPPIKSPPAAAPEPVRL